MTYQVLNIIIINLIHIYIGRSTFDALQHWLDFINEHEKTTIVLLGNKNDLTNKREVTFNEAKQFADNKGIDFYEVSAYTGDCVNHMLYSSIAKLHFFEQFEDNVNTIINEMERSNNKDNNVNTSRSTFSILEQSKGGLRLYKDAPSELLGEMINGNGNDIIHDDNDNVNSNKGEITLKEGNVKKKYKHKCKC